MALISPGVQVTVIDESQYTPTAAGTVPFVLLATAQDKTTPSGTLATYTTKATAGKIYPITSQRDLVRYYGNIEFKVDAADNPINGDERNEYGLLAAYSALGVSNQVYVQRADVDLDQLEGTAVRPTGEPTDGTYWLDVSTNTNWGVYEWTEGPVFSLMSPRVITDAGDLNGTAPLNTIGAKGEYAITTAAAVDGITRQWVYYKRYDNTWVLVGSDAWKTGIPTITGIISNPANLAIGQTLSLNGVNVVLTGTTVAQAASDITAAPITGVTATVNSVGQLEIRVDSTAASSGNILAPDGKLTITRGSVYGNTDCALRLGLFDNSSNVKTLFGPTVSFADYRDVPAWRAGDATPRPVGSVWFKTSATGNGLNWAIKQYSSALGAWALQAAPSYASDNAAILGLDPVGGGATLGVGTLYVKHDTQAASTGTFKLYRKNVLGLLKITGTVAGGSAAYTIGNSFIMEVSVPGSSMTQSATITLTGTTAADLVGEILGAGLPNIVAAIESSGAISISHLAGGTIKFTYVSGSPAPLTTAGIILDNNVQQVSNTVYLASPFKALTYTYATTAPYSNPADGTLWYYNTATEVDIMINTGSKWDGYQNVGNDARGYDLGATDPNGPILAAIQPTLQSAGGQLVPGDLWIDTGNDTLETYPKIYRYNGSTWELIDNTDQVSVDGILFADARWDASGTTDPIVDDLTAISDLLTSDYLDSDAPDYRLYARGTLLFNTRRSGYNVKRFESEWHADAANPPTVVSAWVSASGNDPDGVPYFGHKAQRNVVVEALKSALESSTALREEQTQFNIIACPGYPELISNMITLNNDRKQTAFIIGDTPLDLTPGELEAWGKNSNFATVDGRVGLTSRSEYLGVYYPSGYATDLAGESVVVPPSHMMLRTMIRSDNASYPWFAPAGVRRGVVDNATAIGYIDNADGGLFKSIGVTAGLRDLMYDDLIKINPLTVLPGVGLVAYGQKTRYNQTSALDRINVSRLTAYLRLVLDKVARPFIFEPNDTITRNQVKAGFEAVLNDLVAKRGLYDYLVVCDTTNNTPDRIDRNELYVDIAIKPVKAIEFIYIPVRIRNTGAAL
jgi:hypothetical protein